jgi:hypothetical protein
MSKDYGDKDRDKFFRELKSAHFAQKDPRQMLMKIIKHNFPWVLEKKDPSVV